MKYFFFILFLLITASLFSQEVCDNGIDDDNDGLIDLNDTTDCFCIADTTQSINLIPNPSFENYYQCPSYYLGPGQVIADQWVQVSQGSSDYFNSCGFLGQNGTLTASNGNAYAGFIGHSEIGGMPEYYEYVGTCLPTSMQAGNVYELTFDMAFEYHNWDSIKTLPSPAKISIFGTNNCNDMPLLGPPGLGYPNGTPSYSCPDGYGSFVELGFAYYTPSSNWSSVTITFTTPFNVNGIAVGPSCDLAQNPDYVHHTGVNTPYFFIDNFNLVDSLAISNVDIKISGDTCSNNLLLNTQHSGTGNYQWYYEGVAIVGQITDSLTVPHNNLGSGNYQVALNQNNGCAIDTMFVPEVNLSLNVSNDTNICRSDSLLITANGSSTIFWNNNLPNGNTHLINPNATTAYIATVAGSYNCSISDTIIITVDTLNINLGNDTILCLGEQLPLSINNYATNYNWFNGNTDSLITINQSGNFWLTATNGSCTDTNSIQVTFYQPTALFQTPDTVGCINLTSLFTDLSTSQHGTITNWFWDFGNGDTSTLQTPSNIYQNEGSFGVSLIVTDINGCTDTLFKPNYIVANPNPIADFSFDPSTDIYVDDEIQFFDETTGNPIVWNWNFEENNSVNIQHPTYSYTNPGIYPITLTVENNYGCTSSITKSLDIKSRPLHGHLS